MRCYCCPHRWYSTAVPIVHLLLPPLMVPCRGSSVVWYTGVVDVVAQGIKVIGVVEVVAQLLRYLRCYCCPSRMEFYCCSAVPLVQVLLLLLPLRCLVGDGAVRQVTFSREVSWTSHVGAGGGPVPGSTPQLQVGQGSGVAW